MNRIITLSYIILFVLLLVGSSQAQTVVHASKYMPTNLYDLFMPLKDSSANVSRKFESSDLVNGDFEVHSYNDSGMYEATVYVSMIASADEKTAAEAIMRLNTDQKMKIKKRDTSFIRIDTFPTAGEDAIVATVKNPDHPPKVFFRFRVKKLIMTIQTTGIDMNHVKSKLEAIYVSAKELMKKY